ncbi:MAG: class I SAM-dependent methyltransferase [Egibacteraceae bacterium]
MTVAVDAERARWRSWVRRWDAQQELYIEQRERVFTVMLNLLDHLVGDDIAVLDLAAGTGAISARLLARRPQARSVAVDVDPVLLHLGRHAHGDLDGRLRWVKADLTDPGWVDELGQGRFDAALSATATHWLRPPELAELYRRLATLLVPGGVLLNADHLPLPPHLHRITKALRDEDERRQEAADAAGAETWEGWWDALRAEPALADAFAERDRVFPPGVRRDGRSPDLAFHEAALTQAGFTEVGVVWQDLDERLLLALR